MRRRRFSSIGRLFQIVFAVVLFILLILLILWYQDGLNSFKPEDVTYFYLAGVKVECSDDAKYVTSDEGFQVSDGKDTFTVDSVPIYYQNEKKLTLSSNYMIMRPRETGRNFRVNTFSTLTEKNGRITISLENKSIGVNSGFLFDGDNTYVFLEDTTLTIGPVEIKVPSLSYAKVEYKSFMEYHNSETEKFEWFDLSDMDVVASCNGYELDLGRDIIRVNGVDALLYGAVDNLELIEMK